MEQNVSGTRDPKRKMFERASDMQLVRTNRSRRCNTKIASVVHVLPTAVSAAHDLVNAVRADEEQRLQTAAIESPVLSTRSSRSPIVKYQNCSPQAQNVNDTHYKCAEDLLLGQPGTGIRNKTTVMSMSHSETFVCAKKLIRNRLRDNARLNSKTAVLVVTKRTSF